MSRPAVAKWETDKGLPDVENLKALAALLNVSVDYLLDDSDADSMNEIREAINLNEYEKTGKCRDRRDAVVTAKYPDADSIRPLVRQKKLSVAEWIVDFIVCPGVMNVADQINDTSSYYLVEKGDVQFLVSVSDEFITSSRLARRITEKKFEIGRNRFRAAAFTINDPVR